jgi:RecA/RadA recombinase
MEESSLSAMFRNAVASNKDLRMSVEAKPDVGYPTGFLNFDFMNGYIYHVGGENPDTSNDYYSIGISDGSMVMVIGRTGCGKSTFCAQMGANIVRPFPNASIFEDSLEGGMLDSRRQQLSGFYGEEYKKRYIIRNTGINAENFFKRIKMIHDMKIANPDKFMYDTGKCDMYGKPIHAFEPTVYILDSIAMIMPEDMTEDEELKGSMATTAAAKVVTASMRRIVPLLKMSNIILIIVNHILDSISIPPKKPDLAYLKVGETLPRGKTVTYLCNTLIRLDDKKIKPDEKFHVHGALVNATLCKTRSAMANQSTVLMLDLSIGFDPDLSLFIMLQEAGRIHGAGLGMYFDDKNDHKFSMGTFKEKIHKDPELYQIFIETCLDHLKSIPERQTIGEYDGINTCQNILNMINKA